MMFAVLLLVFADTITAQQPTNLRVELQSASQDLVFGIPTTRPFRVSWTLPQPPRPERGQVQAAYQIQIFASPTNAPIYDSNRVNSSLQTLNISPGNLKPEQTYYWRVRVWSSNSAAIASDWSDLNAFDTEVPTTTWSERGATWIGGFNEMRTQFQVPSGKKLTRARVHATALGAFTLYFNSHRVSDHILDPGQTAYPVRVLYVSFELPVWQFTSDGLNVLGARLGQYKYGYLDVWCDQGQRDCLSLLLQVSLEFDDASIVTLVSNTKDWVGRDGPVIYNNLFHGEVYDARQELAGWASSANSTFPAGTWHAVAKHEPNVLMSSLTPQTFPAVKVMQNFSAVSVRRAANSIFQCNAPYIGGSVPEGQYSASILNLTCQPGSGVISNITFAAYGTPFGDSCSSFAHDPKCDAPTAMSVVKALCLGKSSCQIYANTTTFGGHDPCVDVLKRLSVAATGCTPAPPVHPQTTKYLFDFGQNMAGLATLNLPPSVAAGNHTLIMRFAEILHEDGSLQNTYCSNLPSVDAFDKAVGGCNNCNKIGSQTEPVFGGNCANQTNAFVTNPALAKATYRPEFMYAGFRFVEITGYPANGELPPLDTLVAHFVHSAVPVAGALQLPSMTATPNNTKDVLNRIHHATVSAQISNLFSIPTDCPQRERRGWMGDAHMSSLEAQVNRDMQSFHENFLRNIRDDQLYGCTHNPHSACSDPSSDAGSVGDVTPFTTTPYGSFPGSPVWQAAYIVMTWHLYQTYGDAAILTQHYQGMQDLWGYWTRHADPTTGLVLFGGLGDWNPPRTETTPTPPTSAFYALYCLRLLIKSAKVLGKTSDAATYQTMYDHGAEQYHTKFYNASAQGYSLGSQTSNIMALTLPGVVPANLADTVAQSLVTDILQHENHTSSGIIGCTFVFDLLTQLGQQELAFKMLLRDDFPSFGKMIADNATTLWESFSGDSYTAAGSKNHIMFGGGVGTWLYSAVGLNQNLSDLEQLGWQSVALQPLKHALTLLKMANASYVSRFGPISISWAYSNEATTSRLEIQAALPVGVSGTLTLPCIQKDCQNVAVTEQQSPVFVNGKFVPGLVPGLTGAWIGASAAAGGTPGLVLELGSGLFEFSVVAL
eukprot:m.179111 g.179111  ORF g.179111 m.179111 type:complete len:1109 (+) comp25377_c0_seq1:111-3437(+)